jgi:hypothetical protein
MMLASNTFQVKESGKYIRIKVIFNKNKIVLGDEN